MDYTPVSPNIYTADELQQAIGILQYLHDECVKGNIIQHASPALLIAIDCIAAQPALALGRAASAAVLKG